MGVMRCADSMTLYSCSDEARETVAELMAGEWLPRGLCRKLALMLVLYDIRIPCGRIPRL